MLSSSDFNEDSTKSIQLRIHAEQLQSRTFNLCGTISIDQNNNRKTNPHNQISQFKYQHHHPQTTIYPTSDEVQNHKRTKITVKNGKVNVQFENKQKSNEIYETTHKKVIGSKKNDEDAFGYEMLCQKVKEQESQMQYLKEENRKLIATNKKLQFAISDRKQKEFAIQSQISTVDCELDRSINNISSIAFMTTVLQYDEQKDQLSQLQKLKVDLGKKDQEIKIREKQHQHEKGVLYQNINSKLKIKETECLNITKQLRFQRGKIPELQSKIKQYQDDIQKLNLMIQQAASKIEILSKTCQKQEQQLSKKTLLVGRVRYLQNQNTYINSQLNKYKDQVSVLDTNNKMLVQTNGQLKNQMSVYLCNPVCAPYAEVYSLAKQLSLKDIQISQCSKQLKQLRPLKYEKQLMKEIYDKNSQLLQQSNNQLVKERLSQLNSKYKNNRLY